MRGRGFMDFAKKVHGFVKDNKIISNVGSALGSMGVPYAGKIGSVASSLGYGRLRLAGGYRRRF